MSFLTALVGGPAEHKTIDATNLLLETLLGGSSASKSGVSVNVDSALRVATVFACVRVIAEDIAKLPIRIYREKEDGSKEIAKSHPLHFLLSRRPNDWQTSVQWRQQLMVHAQMTHGGYSWINRAGNGRVMELIPLLPSRVAPRQIPRTMDVVYDVTDYSGHVATLPSSEVFHVEGLSWDGLTGLDPTRTGRDAVGLAIATEESQARLHSNGVRPGGIISTDKSLTKEQVDRIKAQVVDGHTGVQSVFKTLLLDNGLEFKPWAMSGVDAQHIETRKHQIEEVCRLFRVFPAMIGHSDKTATFASTEAFFKAHAIHSLQTWVARWEQAISRDLLLPGEVANGYFAKLDLRGLMAADDAGRSSFYESAITKACWMTRNEARRLEDLDPLPGLDEPLTPLNMTSGTQEEGNRPAKGGQGMAEDPADDGEDAA